MKRNKTKTELKTLLRHRYICIYAHIFTKCICDCVCKQPHRAQFSLVMFVVVPQTHNYTFLYVHTHTQTHMQPPALNAWRTSFYQITLVIHFHFALTQANATNKSAELVLGVGGCIKSSGALAQPQICNSLSVFIAFEHVAVCIFCFGSIFRVGFFIIWLLFYFCFCKKNPPQVFNSPFGGSDFKSQLAMGARLLVLTEFAKISACMFALNLSKNPTKESQLK